MRNNIQSLFIAILLCFSPVLWAQNTLELTADYDAALGYHDNFGTANNNYGTAMQNAAYAIPGTNGGLNVNRSLLHFDLSEIPDGALITQASLSLYALGASGTLNGHSGANNNAIIQRVTEEWTENMVTWNTQPTASDVNEAYLDASTSALQDYTDIDVTALIQDILASNNYGMLLQLANENATNVLLFCSSNHADSSKHPRLILEYSTSIDVQGGQDAEALVDIFPNPSAGFVNIRLHPIDAQQGVAIEITSLQGDVVLTKQLNNPLEKIALDHLPAGMYVIKIHGRHRTISRKIVLSKR